MDECTCTWDGGWTAHPVHGSVCALCQKPQKPVERVVEGPRRTFRQVLEERQKARNARDDQN